jgi:hypothetical protein
VVRLDIKKENCWELEANKDEKLKKIGNQMRKMKWKQTKQESKCAMLEM